VLLEANMDDMTGEEAAHALEQVLAAGALDCWMAPVTMKKGRPGLVFSALSAIGDAGRLAEVILEETSTIGVRQTLVSRIELCRQIETIVTPVGPVRVKISQFEGKGLIKFKPEMDDCASLARELNLPLSEILRQIRAAIELQRKPPRE
jgi:uncharacterized protein (DUF111 family)